MRAGPLGDVLKTVCYAVASVLLGAWLSSWLYQAGMALAEVSEGKRTNRVLDGLADICRVAPFEGYYRAGLVVAGVVLLFPYFEWLRLGAGSGQRLRRDGHGWLHGATGFLWSAGLLAGLGVALVLAGSFTWGGDAPPWREWLRVSLPWAVGLALVQECLFRGVVLGLFLRALKPVAALAGVAVLFAVLRFVFDPQGASGVDPEAGGAGFAMLSATFGRLSQPTVWASEFLPLLALGGLLGFARWRTSALWLPVGLHAGWLFAEYVFRSRTEFVARPDAVAGILAGESLHQGLIPVAALLVSGVMVYFLTVRNDERDAESE